MQKYNWFLYAIIGAVIVDKVINFSILENALVEPSNSPHIGSDLIITCTSSSAHEHCIWKHNDNVCKFDWDRRHRNVLKPTCEAYGKRLTFHGIYPAHECKMKLSNVTKSDSGTWTCEMDNNKKKIYQDINIKVIERPAHPKNESGNKAVVTEDMISNGKTFHDQNKTTSIQLSKISTPNSASLSSTNKDGKEVSNMEANKSGNKHIHAIRLILLTINSNFHLITSFLDFQSHFIVDSDEKDAQVISKTSLLERTGPNDKKESQLQESKLADQSPKIVITSKGSDGIVKESVFHAGKL